MSQSMRAKLVLNEVQAGSTCDILHFRAVGPNTAYPADGSDENNTFAKFTPDATVRMSITNPALLGQFKAGETYYLDFTPAE